MRVGVRDGVNFHLILTILDEQKPSTIMYSQSFAGGVALVSFDLANMQVLEVRNVTGVTYLPASAGLLVFTVAGMHSLRERAFTSGLFATQFLQL